MGAFGFLPQNFGRWQGPTNDIFAPKLDALSGGGNAKTFGANPQNLVLTPSLMLAYLRVEMMGVLNQI